MRLVLDAEANGLLDTADKLWCISYEDIASDGLRASVSEVTGDPTSKVWVDAKNDLRAAEELIGHAIQTYDIPLFKKLWEDWYISENTKVTDTYVLSRLANPDRPRPPQLIKKKGPHSLEAWGHRVGRYKPEHEDWTQFSPEMLHRNVEDKEINILTYHYLITEMGDWDWEEAIRIEHEFARIIGEQERNGVVFDSERAREYVLFLSSEVETIDNEILPQLPKELVQPYKGPIKDPFLKTGGYNKRVRDYIEEAYPNEQEIIQGPFSRIRFDSFDLGSVGKVKEYLLESGWQPENWNYSKTTGERTSPKLEGEFNGIDGEIPQRVKHRISLLKRKSIIEGWLKNLRPDGRLTAGGDSCGTNTGRMKHKIVANVPKANSIKETGELIWDISLQKDLFGTQMRSLFTVPKGYKMVGFDASGLELRMLAHYMNDEEFIKVILEGDVHEYNRNKAGLPDRDASKTFIYAFLYGAGDAKIGGIVGGTEDAGKELKRRFLAGLPKLEKLINRVKRASGKGYLKGLDGRKIWMRRDSSGRIQRNKALNTLLQGGGAIVMKQAHIFLDQWVKEAGLDAKKVIDYHDEAQWEVHEKDVELFTELALKCIPASGEYFKLNIPLEGEVKIGENWAQTH